MASGPSATRARRLHILLALFGLAAYLLHARLKFEQGLQQELYWGCNLTAVLLILGFAFEWTALVGLSFLWRLGLGDPGFLAGLWSGERYFWTAALIHLVPTFLAALYLRRSGLPRSSPYLAMGLSLMAVALGRALAAPALNVNFAFGRLPVLSGWFPGRWSYRVACSVLTVGILLLADAVAARWFGRPAEANPEPIR